MNARFDFAAILARPRAAWAAFRADPSGWLAARFRFVRITRAWSREDYLHRWFLLGGPTTGWGALMLHRFIRSDADVLHDHPWAFWSLVLAGGYWETVPAPGGDKAAGPFRTRWRGPGSLGYRPAETAHRVTIPAGRESWTLVLRFPKKRSWGFWCPAFGWRPWREHLAAERLTSAGCGDVEGPLLAHLAALPDGEREAEAARLRGAVRAAGGDFRFAFRVGGHAGRLFDWTDAHILGPTARALGVAIPAPAPPPRPGPEPVVLHTRPLPGPGGRGPNPLAPAAGPPAESRCLMLRDPLPGPDPEGRTRCEECGFFVRHLDCGKAEEYSIGPGGKCVQDHAGGVEARRRSGRTWTPPDGHSPAPAPEKTPCPTPPPTSPPGPASPSASTT